MNPRKMEQMMKQMGIDVTELDAQEVVIRTGDEELVFTDAQVTRMDAQGQQTYQVVGSPESRDRGEGDDGSAGEAGNDSSGESGTPSEESGAPEIPADDVEIVAQRAGVSSDAAREALEAENGDLAAAISQLE